MSIIASTARSSGASPALDRQWLAAALVLLGWIATPALAETPPAHAHDAAAMGAPAAAPLVEKVRTATRRYLDINAALAEGWVQATPCVSSPTSGAMGVHFIKPERLHDGELKADEPEMLIYEPLPDAKFRLVGVEYVVLASEWFAKHAAGVAPSVDGHLANFVSDPNRYALPAFYEMHVWAWEDNPAGSFSDFNARVSCGPQRTPA